MPATRLETRRVEKPWGRHDLGQPFGDVPAGNPPVGEIWFGDGTLERELLIKYLFTSERLSIQVHPDDELARAAGQPRGKSEAWVILDAEPHAELGIGTREVLSGDELRAASLDGRIEGLLQWRAVRTGDFFYSPAGTVHALGPGLKLIEIQQNSDTTYRLFDYGRPRELHLDDGVAASHAVPYVDASQPETIAPGRTRLVGGPLFVLERWTGERDVQFSATRERPAWLVPVDGVTRVDGEIMEPGTAWLADGEVRLALGDSADLLVAMPGAAPLSLA